jgi:SAM-dependent methyltransferase
MNLSDINKREIDFHNKLQSGKENRSEGIFYKALYNLFADFHKYLYENSQNKIVLDYGCGIGSLTEKVAKSHPEKIVGIDISNISIDKAIARAKEYNLNVEYKVDNCENSNLESNTFDLIYGSGILHHLNLEKSAKEINRLLKKNGKMLFIEPLGTNPIINIYRKLTPKSRSEDEHPFLPGDFDFLKSVYAQVNVKYYGFFTLVFFPFYRKPEKSIIYNFFAAVDQKIFKIKIFRFLAWSVLIEAKKI